MRSVNRKGNHAERAVKLALEREGYVVLDGRSTESAIDLVAFEPTGSLYRLIEVKARDRVYNLYPKDKRSLARRAAWCRYRNWPYRLYFIPDSKPQEARIYVVGDLEPSPGRNGNRLTLYEDGFLDLTLPTGAPRKGEGASP